MTISSGPIRCRTRSGSPVIIRSKTVSHGRNTAVSGVSVPGRPAGLSRLAWVTAAPSAGGTRHAATLQVQTDSGGALAKRISVINGNTGAEIVDTSGDAVPVSVLDFAEGADDISGDNPQELRIALAEMPKVNPIVAKRGVIGNLLLEVIEDIGYADGLLENPSIPRRYLSNIPCFRYYKTTVATGRLRYTLSRTYYNALNYAGDSASASSIAMHGLFVQVMGNTLASGGSKITPMLIDPGTAGFAGGNLGWATGNSIEVLLTNTAGAANLALSQSVRLRIAFLVAYA